MSKIRFALQLVVNISRYFRKPVCHSIACHLILAKACCLSGHNFIFNFISTKVSSPIVLECELLSLIPTGYK